MIALALAIPAGWLLVTWALASYLPDTTEEW